MIVAGQGEDLFGYRLPDRFKIEWVSIPGADIRSSVENSDAVNRVALLKHDLFDLTPQAHDFSAYGLVTAIDLFHGYFYEGRDRLLGLFRALRQALPTQRIAYRSS